MSRRHGQPERLSRLQLLILDILAVADLPVWDRASLRWAVQHDLRVLGWPYDRTTVRRSLTNLLQKGLVVELPCKYANIFELTPRGWDMLADHAAQRPTRHRGAIRTPEPGTSAEGTRRPTR